MTLKHIGPIACVLTATLFVAFGPDWPPRATDLRCGSSSRVAQVYPDMDACAREMEAQPEHCYCSVPDRGFLTGPLWYGLLVPAFLIAAIWMTNKDTGRAMAAAFGAVFVAAYVLPLSISLLYLAGFRIPPFLQNVLFVWPQWVFFIFYSSRGPVLPWQWAYLAPIGFWISATLLFGLCARRVKAKLVLFPLATTFVVVVVVLVGRIAPMIGWRIQVELP